MFHCLICLVNLRREGLEIELWKYIFLFEAQKIWNVVILWSPSHLSVWQQPSIKQCQQWTWVTTQQTTLPDNIMYNNPAFDTPQRKTRENPEVHIGWNFVQTICKHYFWKLPDEGRVPRIGCPISTTTCSSPGQGLERYSTLRWAPQSPDSPAPHTSGGWTMPMLYVKINCEFCWSPFKIHG